MIRLDLVRLYADFTWAKLRRYQRMAEEQQVRSAEMKLHANNLDFTEADRRLADQSDSLLAAALLKFDRGDK